MEGLNGLSGCFRLACLPVFICWIVMVVGCSPVIMESGPPKQDAAMGTDYFAMPDGEKLPLHTWIAESGDPQAIVIAIHGFNDYGHFFGDLGRYLGTRGITSYAYDQRGFGRSPHPGFWAGADTYISDVKTVLGLLKERHPGIPVFMFGESMGGAVLMAAATDQEPLQADGFILAAPAVWGRRTMPFYQRAALWLAVHTVPGMTLTGRGLNITPSDNMEMLKALGRDPLVIKETRVDAIWGIVNLMDRALASAPSFGGRSLILYGARDEVIPKKPTRDMLNALPDVATQHHRVAVYDDGYHMLIRDLMAETVWRDIHHWIISPDQALPSKAEGNLAAFLEHDQ